jgi:hypothetical protein
MVKFSEEFLDNLAPRDQVFEIKEESDFAIRVFPNGSKTWVFLSTIDHGIHRRTLGIYPQMSIKQAHEALQRMRETSAGSRGVEAGAEDTVAPNRAQKPQDRSWLPGKVAMAVVMGALSVGGLLTLQANGDIQLLWEGLQKTPGFVKTSAPVGATRSTKKVEIHRSAPASGSPGPGPVGERRVLTPKAQSPGSKSQAASKNAETGPPSPVPSMAIGVKRAQFTNGIGDREPIDRIPKTLPAWNIKEGSRQIFFFTEVTGLGGHTIYHRWELNGRVISEIPFEVKSAWRWRVYSSKNILPTMAGQWRVTVIDDSDNVLYSQSLILASKHLMSAANTPQEPEQLRISE